MKSNRRFQPSLGIPFNAQDHFRDNRASDGTERALMAIFSDNSRTCIYEPAILCTDNVHILYYDVEDSVSRNLPIDLRWDFVAQKFVFTVFIAYGMQLY